jgi:ketosteroid isomerase-like protein
MRTRFALLLLLVAACGADDRLPIKPPPPPELETVPLASDTSSAPPVASSGAPQKSAPQRQMDTVNAIVDATNAHDAAAVASHYTGDALLDVYGRAIKVARRSAIQRDTQRLFDTFADVKLGVSRVFERGQTWAIEWTWTGTQKGTFLGVTPKKGADAGAPVPVGAKGLSILWFDDGGRIAKEHRYIDMMTVRAQLLGEKGARAVPALPSGSIETHVSAGNGDEDKNVAATLAWLGDVTAGKTASYSATLTDDATFEDMTAPAPVVGKKASLDSLATQMKAFPVASATQPLSFGVEDWVIVEWDVKGTPKGPTALVDVHGVDLARWKAGKLVLMTTYANAKEALDQTGKSPK